jgi:hypothetical protein
MLYIVVIGLGLVEIVFQLVVAPVFSIFTIFPNIILITVVLLFVFLDFNFSMSFAFACGLVLDLLEIFRCYWCGHCFVWHFCGARFKNWHPFWNTFNIEQRTSKYESTL